MKIKNHILQSDKVDQSIQSPNQNGTIEPTVIVLHYTASGGEDGKDDATYLSRASARASAQLVVGRNGSIHQLMPLNKRAWHAGKSELNGRKDLNSFSIGIEIDNWGWLKNGKSHAGVKVPEDQIFEGTRSGHSQWESYKPEQLEATEELIAAICKNYQITDIVGHEDVSPGRKQDPGPALDAFMEEMRAKYLKDAKPKTTATKKTKKTSQAGSKKVTANGLRLRARPNYTAAILTHLYDGYTVEVLKRDVYPGWDQVRYKNKVGFIANQYLTSV